MKIIGLLGGMSWESTVTYYQVINEVVKKQLGGLHSAKCVLYSVDFEEIREYQKNGEWDKSGELLAEAAISLKNAGADFILICTNTMHKVIDQIEEAVNIPVLHIAKMTALKLKEDGVSCVGLLGTRYTMEQEFYKKVLIEEGIKVVIPNSDEMDVINSVIFDELCLGQIKESSRASYLTIMEKLRDEGAQGIILGCTEIGLLVNEKHINLALYDTAKIHATLAAFEALK